MSTEVLGRGIRECAFPFGGPAFRALPDPGQLCTAVEPGTPAFGELRTPDNRCPDCPFAHALGASAILPAQREAA